MSKSTVAAVALAGFLFGPAAHAAFLTWTLNGVTATDSTGTQSLTGTFDYDPVTNTYQNIMISSTGTAGYPATNFTSVTDFAPLNYLLRASVTGNQLNAQLLRLEFSSPLTAAGGSIPLALPSSSAATTGSYIASCAGLSLSSGLCSNLSIVAQRPLVTAGSVSAVPLPAAAWLLLSGLGGLAALGKRHLRR